MCVLNDAWIDRSEDICIERTNKQLQMRLRTCVAPNLSAYFWVVVADSQLVISDILISTRLLSAESIETASSLPNLGLQYLLNRLHRSSLSCAWLGKDMSCSDVTLAHSLEPRILGKHMVWFISSNVAWTQESKAHVRGWNVYQQRRWANNHTANYPQNFKLHPKFCVAASHEGVVC